MPRVYSIHRLLGAVLLVSACSSGERPSGQRGTPDAGAPVPPDSGGDSADVGPPPTQPIDPGKDSGPDATIPPAPASPDGGPMFLVPVVSSITPSAVAIGEEVRVSGAHFEPGPRVRFRSLRSNIELKSTSGTQLTFVVPKDLTSTACDSTIEVVVGNAYGDAEPVALRVTRPGPTLDPNPATSVIAGETLTLSGRSLLEASVTSAAATLTARAAYDRIAISVPREAPTGRTEVRIRTACGETSLSVEIKPRVPRIVSVDIPTAAPNGVLFVTADFGERSSVLGMKVGGRFISASDAPNFAWPSPDLKGLANVLGVRVPSDLPYGEFNLVLVGATGESPAKNIGFVTMYPGRPPVAKDIVFVAPDARFESFHPSNKSDLLVADDAVPPRSGYIMEFFPSLDPDEDAGANGCATHGDISGDELDCACENFGCECEACGCDVTQCKRQCSTLVLQGTSYRLDGRTNQVDFRIQPMGLEFFQGGWVFRRQVDPDTIQADLVVRSLRTGAQYIAHHELTRACN